MDCKPSRRDVIWRAAAAAIAAGLPVPLAAFTADQFLALSKSLTGVSDLDPGIARTILGGFLATGHEAALNRLASGPAAGPADQAVASAIVAAWYSGLYETVQGQAVATFDQALLWNALSFTKPLGACGGEFGYWSDPPQA